MTTTDKLLEDIKADREAGTKGPWEHDEFGQLTSPPPSERQQRQSVCVSHLCISSRSREYGVTMEEEANGRRFARVPEMEARILSDSKKIEAADELALAITSIVIADIPDVWTPRNAMEATHCALNAALEIYRKAGGDV